MRLVDCLAASCLLPCALGSPIHSESQNNGRSVNQRASNACGRVREAQTQGAQFVPPSLALECLNSVPLDVQRDSALVDYMTPFVSFQSSLAYLRSPPSSYLKASGGSGVDILQGLHDIRQKVSSESYKSQYEFTAAVEQLIRQGRDSHFSVSPILNKVFLFVRGTTLVSVSKDGTSLPEFYEIDDFLASLRTGYEASAVSKLDGIPVNEALSDIASSTGRAHDLDAGLNILLPSKAKGATGVSVADYFTAGTYLSLPDNTTLQLANGTTISVPNVAMPQLDFTGVLTGEDLHKVAELGAASSTTKRAATDTAVSGVCPQPSPRPRNWPTLVDEHREHWAGGYFLASENDTAVLELNAFKSYLPAGGDSCILASHAEYHRFIESFIRRFRAAGKTRLILDLSGNTGGYEGVLADTADQLFPGRFHGFHYRARATPALRWIIDATTGIDGATGIPLLDDLHAENWPGSFGPEAVAGDNYTHLLFRDVMAERARANINDTLLTSPLVKPEDMVIITDGDCHSACALLVSFLAGELGVRTVAVGGRPVAAPMQAVGGSKGGGPYTWSNWQMAVDMAVRNGGKAAPAGPGVPSLGASPIRTTGTSINSMDVWNNFSSADAPVEFVWEPAYCRLFYTADTLRDISAMWKQVANVAWHGGKCVPGSTANADGTIGAKPPVSKEMAGTQPKEAKEAKEANAQLVQNADDARTAFQLPRTINRMVTGWWSRGNQLISEATDFF